MVRPGVSWKRFLTDLKNEAEKDNVFNGAAALAYYLTLAIFPAMLFLLAIIPYLPIPHIDQAIWDLIQQMMPLEAAKMFSGTIQEITSNKKSGLLSLGFLGTVWAASNGTFAIMQELNNTYHVTEGRSFLKARATALGLTLLVGALFLTALTCVVLGGEIQAWLIQRMGGANQAIHTFFAILRWVIFAAAALLAFAVTYYFGPDVEQRFRFITPGSVTGTLCLLATSVGLRLYVTHFGNFSATYGSIGAVIVLMLWLYVIGLVVLLGSEINALLEQYSPDGKRKGEKQEVAA